MSFNQTNIAISVSNVSKYYPLGTHPWKQLSRAILKKPVPPSEGYHALSNISFSVKKGQTVGIIGKNGAGKSTLLQMVCGTLQPSSGLIHVNGRVAALLELGAGFNPEFTGKENVYLNGSIYGLSAQEIDDRFQDIQDFAEIGEFIHQPVKTYSSGMFVRLAFAVLAHVDADVLIIDEALAVGDAYFTQKCMRFLNKFREQGSLLFVSHDTSSVMALCSEAIWLDGGKIREQGNAKDVCECYLASLFGDSNTQILPAEVKVRVESNEDAVPADQRSAWINSSNLRNDIEVFEFTPEVKRFGEGSARIDKVGLYDEQGAPLAWVVGGEYVQLLIRASIFESLPSPIVGFYFKDRLGQSLFGDNTWVTTCIEPLNGSGEYLEARFKFRMPFLPAGDYSIAAAVGNGSPAEHEQHDWIHDALMIRAHGGPVSGGLIGLPMQKIVFSYC